MASIISTMLRAQRIAIVGISDNPSRPSFGIAMFLLSRGKEILPVNPGLQQWNDLPCYPSLTDVPGPIDLVNVFRRPEHCAQVARDAVAADAKGLWLQSGIRSEEAKAIAVTAGLAFVQDRCIMIELSMMPG